MGAPTVKVSAARVAYAFVSVVGYSNALRMVDSSGRIPFPSGIARVVDLGWVATEAGKLGLGAVVVLGAALFAFTSWEILGAALIFVGMGIATTVGASMVPDATGFSHSGMLTAVTLAAYVVGFLSHRDLPLAERRRAAWEMTTAGVAACYMLAAISKLRSHGLAWGDGGSMAMLVEERRYYAVSVVSDLRGLLATHPAVLGVLGWYALLVELAAPAFMFASSRFYFLVAVCLMHEGIGLMMGYHYLDWIILDAAIFLLTDPEATAR
jgi:hypothetical protein